MARPKSPEKLLREALEKGDVEAAKSALAAIEKNKIKEKKVSKPKKVKEIEPVKETNFRVSKTTNNDDDEDNGKGERAYGSSIKVGIKKNNFKPDPKIKFAVDKILTGMQVVSDRDRQGISIKDVEVICDNCKKKYIVEEWDKRESGNEDEPENLCKKCIRKIFHG